MGLQRSADIRRSVSFKVVLINNWVDLSVIMLCRVMGVLPQREAESLRCLLSSQWISEDVFGVGSPRALSPVRLCTGLCRLGGFLS